MAKMPVMRHPTWPRLLGARGGVFSLFAVIVVGLSPTPLHAESSAPAYQMHSVNASHSGANQLNAARASLEAGQGPALTGATGATWTRAIIQWDGTDPAMAFDPAVGAVVLFQGLSGSPSNSTWTFAGGQWTQLNLSVTPPERSGEAMVYDATDGELVLFGGVSSQGVYLNDTWVFDGARWMEVNSSATGAPPGREYPSMAYDPGAKGVLLFGGTSAYWYSFNCYGQTYQDTWVFSGGFWTRDTTNGSGPPSERYGASLAYDPYANASILFGGEDYLCATNSTRLYNDTWAFNGSGWSNLSSPAAPPARILGGLASSSLGNSLYLFGGSTGGIPFWIGMNAMTDTWRFSNGSWHQIQIAGPSPGPAVDPLVSMPNGTLLLFGVPLWLFTGSGWEMTPAPEPPVTWSPLLAYDSSDRYVLFYGGEGANYQVHSTWSFRNGTWANLTNTSVSTPPIGDGDVMADDPADGYIVLFAAGSNTTWTFGAGDWHQLHPSLTPSARSGTTMVYDATDGYVLLFGGTDCYLGYWWTGCVWHNDTWEFARGNWSQMPDRSSPTPLGRSYAAMSFDQGDQEVVMFGGVHCTTGKEDCAALNDTWTFANGTWSQVHPAVSPSPRAETAVSYDWSNASVVLFGGVGVAPSNSPAGIQPGLWSYSKGAWSQVPTLLRSGLPGGSASAAFVYVPDLRSDLLYLWSGNAWYLQLGPAVLALNATASLSATVGDAPLKVQFSALASGGSPPYAYAWTFGDGSVGVEASPAHTYSSAGSYMGEVLVTDSTGSSVDQHFAVLVHSPPAAVGSFAPSQGSSPLSVSFNGSVAGGTPPVSARWDFGDGSSGTTLNATHTYYGPGTYEASLVISDAVGGSSTWGPFPIVVTAPVAPLVAQVVALPDPAYVGASVQLRAAISGGIAPFEYNWSGLPSGDCGVPNLAGITCILTRSGTFQPALIITDGAGASVTTSTVVVVLRNHIQVNVTVSPVPAIVGEVVRLMVLPSGGVAPYTIQWTGLPEGCPPGNASQFQCEGVPQGVYQVGAIATDYDNETGGTNATLVVEAPPVMASPAAQPLWPAWVVIGSVGGLAAGAGIMWVTARFLRRSPPESPPN